MKFGVRLPVNGPFASRDSIADIAKLADDYSFHSVWGQGHVLWSMPQHQTQISVGSFEALSESQSPNMFDSFSTLFYTSAITKKVMLGSAVFVTPLIHPVLAARFLANLDVFSDGRLIFCTSPGGPLIKKDFESLGIDFARRAKIADEYLEAIIKLWTHDATSFAGEFVGFNDVSIYPKPVQKPHPSIWIAGGDPNAIGRAAKFGDGWMLTTADPRTVKGGISKIIIGYEKLRERSRQLGRVVKDLAIDIYTCVGETDEQASLISSKTIAARLKRQAQSANLSVPTEQEVQSVNLIGSPSTIAEKVEAFEKAGVTVLELKMMSWDLEQMKIMLKTFAKDIMHSF